MAKRAKKKSVVSRAVRTVKKAAKSPQRRRSEPPKNDAWENGKKEISR